MGLNLALCNAFKEFHWMACNKNCKIFNQLWEILFYGKTFGQTVAVDWTLMTIQNLIFLKCLNLA